MSKSEITSKTLDEMPPSQLLRFAAPHVAAYDALTKEQPDHFAWNMNRWLLQRPPKCWACLAGAVAYGAGVDPFDSDWSSVIDYIREGDFEFLPASVGALGIDELIETRENWAVEGDEYLKAFIPADGLIAIAKVLEKYDM